MRYAIVSLILSTALWAQPNVITPVLSQPEVEALEAKVASNPTGSADLRRLANNYVFYLLGITKLKQYDQVDGFDQAKAESPFATHVRVTLNETRIAPLAAESAFALWRNLSTVAAYRSLHGDPAIRANPIDVKLSSALIDRAIELDPGTPNWRSYRMYILNAYGSKSDQPRTYLTMKSDLAVVTGHTRSNMLQTVAKQAVLANQWDDARALAEEMLAEAQKSPKNSGNAIFTGNTILGQFALHQGDTKAAAQYLLASVAITGSPQLDSFGPSMVLAKGLLDAGAGREQVLEFLDLCAKFWKMDYGKLKEWSVLVKGGLTPDFVR